MEKLEILLGLMCILLTTGVFAAKARLPLPIGLLLAGILVSFLSKSPLITLDPQTIFLIFLPPLLFEAAQNLSWHEFKEWRMPISFLAIGLVFFTMFCVAVTAHLIIPDFSWQLGFLLGAIVAPPDAVAATSATKNLPLPKHLITILEGESLVNDASSLICYQFALLSILQGKFSLFSASWSFVAVSIGGVGVGLLIAIIINKVTQQIDDPTIATIISLLTPVTAYLVAAKFDVSGVLSVVSCSLYLAWHSSLSVSFQTRFRVKEFWEVMIYLLNGFVFLLIGLQLPEIWLNLNRHSIILPIFHGIVISMVVIMARLVWVFPFAFLRIYGYNRNNQIKIAFNRRAAAQIFITGWAGMRGVVSLAAAMALPLVLDNGNAFPARDKILFLTFIVIVFTLLVHGLTLPYFVRKLRVYESLGKHEFEVSSLKREMLNLTLDFIEHELSPSYPEQLLERHRLEITHWLTITDFEPCSPIRQESLKNIKLRHEVELKLISFQRSKILEMQRNNRYPHKLLRELENGLDIFCLQVHSKQQSLLVTERKGLAK